MANSPLPQPEVMVEKLASLGSNTPLEVHSVSAI